MKKIFFDLDGVLANFEKSAVKHTGNHYWERHSHNIWNVLEHVNNFFLNLEPLAGSIELFEMVLDIHGVENVEILTALPNPTGALANVEREKRMWVKNHLHPSVVVNTVYGGKNKCKWLQYHPESLLIDDTPKNIVAWIEHGGTGIVHTDVESTIEKLKVLNVL